MSVLTFLCSALIQKKNSSLHFYVVELATEKARTRRAREVGLRVLLATIIVEFQSLSTICRWYHWLTSELLCILTYGFHVLTSHLGKTRPRAIFGVRLRAFLDFECFHLQLHWISEARVIYFLLKKSEMGRVFDIVWLLQHCFKTHELLINILNPRQHQMDSLSWTQQKNKIIQYPNEKWYKFLFMGTFKTHFIAPQIKLKPQQA